MPVRPLDAVGRQDAEHRPQGVRGGERLVVADIPEEHGDPVARLGLGFARHRREARPCLVAVVACGGEARHVRGHAEVGEQGGVVDDVEHGVLLGVVARRCCPGQGDDVARLPRHRPRARAPRRRGAAPVQAVEQAARGVGGELHAVAGGDGHEAGEQRRACCRVGGHQVGGEVERLHDGGGGAGRGEAPHRDRADGPGPDGVDRRAVLVELRVAGPVLLGDAHRQGRRAATVSLSRRAVAGRRVVDCGGFHPHQYRSRRPGPRPCRAPTTARRVSALWMSWGRPRESWGNARHNWG